MNRAWPKIAGLVLSLLAMSSEVLGASDGFRIPADTRQLVIAQAGRWDASEVTMQRWERTPPAESPQPWTVVGPPVKARVGRSGLAWGRGLHPRATDRIAKREGDWRAPAGVFRIGDAYGDHDAPPPSTRLPYHRVTENDLWVEDPDSPEYNHHLRVPERRGRTPWEESQRMKLGDPAHRLKIGIAHNRPPDVAPGAGSAIFFHIWRRDGGLPTSGCTAMAEAHLRTMLAWLDPDAQPLFVILPTEVFNQVKDAWGLP
jgi:L,D-peptidoglycan transpeptidase YkuD (ErfK/YbiS/YcfS/YnhG family)